MNRSRSRGRHPSIYRGFYAPEPPDEIYQDDAKAQKLSTDDAGSNPLKVADASVLMTDDAQANQQYMDDAKSNPIQGED